MLKTERCKDPAKYIKFGTTKITDYSKIHGLGRGTYGEVEKCIHISSGIEVAIKKYLSSVSFDFNTFVEYLKWY